MIQNVNDGGYMKEFWKAQHPEDDYDSGGYLLFEVGNRGLELKKAKKNFKDQGEIALFEKILNREADIFEHMDADDISTFFIGETLTGNWDGACLRYIPNNYYIAVTRNHTNSPKIRYIPKGMDRVFQGCAYEMGQNYFMGGMEPPYCGPMQKLLSNASMAARYEFLKSKANSPYRKRTCGEDVGALSVMIVGSCAIALGCVIIGFLALHILKHHTRFGRKWNIIQ